MRKRNKPRLTAAIAGALAMSALTLGSAAQANHHPEGGSSLPHVNMAQVVRAAQLDPYRAGSSGTTGAKRSVKRVQRALRAHLVKKYEPAVDGDYGFQTQNAYARWQRKIGSGSGYHSNGLPGAKDLARLVNGRYAVTHAIHVGKKISFRGAHGVSKTVNKRTAAMIRAAQRRLGKGCKLALEQGSYSTSVAESKKTHAGGGAIDVAVHPEWLCGKTIIQVRNALRKVGFAAWFRDWTGNQHIHANAIADPQMATPAAYPGEYTSLPQIGGWAQGGDGLNTPSPGTIKRELKHTWESYKRAH